MPSATKARARVRQKAKGPIDPAFGRRLRSLREARTLTQAQLAGPDFTPGFISLVENGRTRVSLRAAEILARRLEISVVDLVGDEGGADAAANATIARAEAELRAGRASAAIELLRPIDGRAAPSLRARMRRVHGKALVALGRPREAVPVLDDALRAFRTARDTESMARTMYDLAVAHARAQSIGDALGLALQAEHTIASGDVVDRTLELELLTFLATLFVTLGDYDAADLRAERAKAIAQDVADPSAVASLYQSLAATRQEQGDFEAALAYARRSLQAYEQLRHTRAIASTWNTIGWIYVKRGQTGRAAEALDRAWRLAQAQSDGRLAAYVLQSRAELEMSRGDFPAAVRLAEESARHPQASARARALSLLVRAEALAKTRAPLAALNAAFRDAFEALEPHGRRQLAKAYRAHFEALVARGESKQAVVSARRALELMQPALQ